MVAIIPDGAVVWIKDPAKDSTEAFVKATVSKFTEGRGYTVKTTDGKERTVRRVVKTVQEVKVRRALFF